MHECSPYSQHLRGGHCYNSDTEAKVNDLQNFSFARTQVHHFSEVNATSLGHTRTSQCSQGPCTAWPLSRCHFSTQCFPILYLSTLRMPYPNLPDLFFSLQHLLNNQGNIYFSFFVCLFMICFSPGNHVSQSKNCLLLSWLCKTFSSEKCLAGE